MKPHIAQTIEDIELKIGFLQRLAGALRSFDDVTAVGASVPETARGDARPTSNGHAKVALPKPAGGGRGLNLRGCKPSKRGAEMMRVVALVETMPEPITAPKIAEAASVNAKKAANFIQACQRKGWLGKIKFGEYRRLAGFGGGVLGGGGEQLLAEIHAEIDAAKPKKDD